MAGTSGAGKSSLARRIEAATLIPHVELDALHYGPKWTPRPEFEEEVRLLAAQSTWVTEWQYGSARPLLLARDDLARPRAWRSVTTLQGARR